MCDGTALDDIDLDLPTSVPPTEAPTPTALTSSSSSTTTPSTSSSFVLPEGGIMLEAVERDFVRQALERAAGNKSQAARLLGLTRATLRYRLDKYDLDRSPEKGTDSGD
jgi:DNA-binding NtrC family response regulator